MGRNIVAHRFDETHLTVARQVAAGGARRYVVWLRRGTATVVHVYEAASGEDAKRQALAELVEAERLLSAI